MPTNLLQIVGFVLSQLPAGPIPVSPAPNAPIGPTPAATPAAVIQDGPAVSLGTPQPTAAPTSPIPSAATSMPGYGATGSSVLAPSAPEATPTAADSPVQSKAPASHPATPAVSAPSPDGEPPMAPFQSKAVAADTDGAARLLDEVLEAPRRNGLTGEPMSLSEALGRADPMGRQAVVSAYWRLCDRVARFHFAVEEAEFLASLVAPASRCDVTLLNARRAAARAARIAERLATVRAQYELAGASWAVLVERLPLPSDRPLVVRYDTRADTILANQATPSNLLRIDRTLPLMRQRVEALAASVAAAKEARQTLRQARPGGQAQLADVLAAAQQLHSQRREFLAAVLEYNEQIAQYALSVAAPGVSPQVLVSMLIETKRPERSVLIPRNGVQQAAAEQKLEPVPANPPLFRDVTPPRP